MKRLALLVALTLTACGEVDPYTGQYVDAQYSSILGLPRGAPIKLSAPQTADLQSRIGRQLRDPASAIFGPMAAGASAGGGIVVCGFVNAKNGFGGYTGEQMFVAEINGVTVDLDVLDGSPDYAVHDCRFAGAIIG